MTRKSGCRFPFLIFCVFILFSIGVGATIGVIGAVIENMPRLEVFEYNPSLTTKIYDRNEQLVADLFYIENRIRVPITNIPQHLQNAIVAVEDERFYGHYGIDFRAIARAFVEVVRHRDAVQGGSTITQQLAKNAFLTHDKTMWRKIQEAVLAIQLERKYTKEEILELYLNEIYLGHAAYGVAAGAQTYFAKNVWELDLAESALIAGITRGAAYYSPFINMDSAINRRNLILNLMADQGYISWDEAEEAKQQPINILPEPKIRTRQASYFLDQVVKELLARYGEQLTYRGGLTVHTTLDLEYQSIAEDVFLSNLPEWFANDGGIMQPQGAIVVMDPHTGYVHAMVGGRGTDKYNRAVQAVRQPGSAFKPFVYAVALEEGYSPATILHDSPIEYRNSDGSIYAPSNFDNRFRGPITLRSSLQDSINVTSVKLLSEIGLSKVWNVAQSLGISTLDRSNDYNLALALGGLTRGVTLLEMSTAYSIIANHGIVVEPILIKQVVDKDGVILEDNRPRRSILPDISEDTFYLLNSILQGAITDGTGRAADINRPQAGKTGTSDDNTNAWFIGYTPNLLAGVYLGNDAQNQPMRHNGVIIGSRQAAIIWGELMDQILEGTPIVNFPEPSSNIITLEINKETGLLASEIAGGTTITENFRKGTEPTDICIGFKEEYADVCTLSDTLATDDCPESYIIRKKYYDVLVQTSTGSYEQMFIPSNIFDEYCNIH